MQLIQLGLVLKDAGFDIWGQIQAARATKQPDGTESVELVISVRMDRLVAYMAQEQSDLSETLAEIARREAIALPGQ